MDTYDNLPTNTPLLGESPYESFFPNDPQPASGYELPSALNTATESVTEVDMARCQSYIRTNHNMSVIV